MNNVVTFPFMYKGIIFVVTYVGNGEGIFMNLKNNILFVKTMNPNENVQNYKLSSTDSHFIFLFIMQYRNGRNYEVT